MPVSRKRKSASSRGTKPSATAILLAERCIEKFLKGKVKNSRNIKCHHAFLIVQFVNKKRRDMIGDEKMVMTLKNKALAEELDLSESQVKAAKGVLSENGIMKFWKTIKVKGFFIALWKPCISAMGAVKVMNRYSQNASFRFWTQDDNGKDIYVREEEMTDDLLDRAYIPSKYYGLYKKEQRIKAMDVKPLSRLAKLRKATKEFNLMFADDDSVIIDF